MQTITISGDIGTGKTTLARWLASYIRWDYINAADIYFQLQKSIQVIATLNREVDENIRTMAKTAHHLIIDGHYQGWNLREMDSVYRILVVCDPEILNARIAIRCGNDSEKIKNEEERKYKLFADFKQTYGDIDYLNESYYSLIVINDGSEVSMYTEVYKKVEKDVLSK